MMDVSFSSLLYIVFYLLSILFYSIFFYWSSFSDLYISTATQPPEHVLDNPLSSPGGIDLDMKPTSMLRDVTSSS